MCLNATALDDSGPIVAIYTNAACCQTPYELLFKHIKFDARVSVSCAIFRRICTLHTFIAPRLAPWNCAPHYSPEPLPAPSTHLPEIS